MRIVSLLPSATEIVCALGLGERLVGVTHECDWPACVLDLPKVTRTLIPQDATSRQIDDWVRERLQTQRALYTLDLPVLEALCPDVIVTQALCDVCAVAEEEVRAAACCLPSHPRVVNLEPATLAQVLDSIAQVAEATGNEGRAKAVIHGLNVRIDAVVAGTESLRDRPRVALLEWIDPPFSCGHWSPELVRLAGGVEGIGREGSPSRTLRWDELVGWQPEVLCIACCGFSVERTLQDVEILRGCPSWEDFSRPGPRLVDSLEILGHALHPNVHPLPSGLPAAVSVL
jgi:iron complex transport system substrate-binding protein